MYEMACADAGFSCKVRFSAKSQEVLQKQVEEHAIAVHGLEHDDFTPDLLRKLRSITRVTEGQPAGVSWSAPGDEET